MQDREDNRLKIVTEALRHTEMQIANLNVLASGAETRALHFATLNTAFGTILAINAKSMPGPLLAYVSAAMLLIVACLSVALTLPRRFHVTGHYWREWSDHLLDDDCIIDVLVSQAEENDDRIEYNNDSLETSARSFRRCFSLLVLVFCFFLGSQMGAFIQLS